MSAQYAIRSNIAFKSSPAAQYNFYLALGSAAVADLIITYTLCILLFKNRTHVRQYALLRTGILLWILNCNGFIERIRC
jgi:hypothetical protein